MKVAENNFKVSKNIPFLTEGVLSVSFNFGLFCLALALLLVGHQWVEGEFTEIGKRKLYLLIGTHLFVSFSTAVVLCLIRLRAISKLKMEKPEAFEEFLNSNNDRKHEILGSLL